MATYNRTRRGKRADENPLYEQAKHVGDVLFERAKALVDIIAPERPVDAEPLDEYEQWEILERVAQTLSPGAWDDPDALDTLFRLRRRFAGSEDEWLKTLAKEARERKRMMPDISITPENPDYEKKRKQWGL